MALLKNKQFWTAVLALVQTLVLNYLGVPTEIWVSINAILVIVIAQFTVEDVVNAKKETSKIYSETVNKAVLTLSKLNKDK